MCFNNLCKIQIFTEAGDTQNLHFWFNSDPRFSLKIVKIEKKKIFSRKNFSHRVSKYRKIKALSSLIFPGKIRLLFALCILSIFGWKPAKIKGQRVRIKIWNSFFYEHGSWASSNKKKFGSSTFQFCGLGANVRFCKILTHFFKFGCFSRYHAQIFIKTSLDFPMQNLILNRLAPI